MEAKATECTIEVMVGEPVRVDCACWCIFLNELPDVARRHGIDQLRYLWKLGKTEVTIGGTPNMNSALVS